jgi:putative FmdB family regulatory protein
MPTYRYRCARCEETFERVESFAEHRANKPRCPKCGGGRPGADPVRGEDSQEELALVTARAQNGSSSPILRMLAVKNSMKLRVARHRHSCP